MCHPVDPYVGMTALMYELMNDLIVRSTIQDYSKNHAHQLGLRICLLLAGVPPALRSLAPHLHRQAEDSSCNGQTHWNHHRPSRRKIKNGRATRSHDDVEACFP